MMAKELTDALLIEFVELCALDPELVKKKIDLMDYLEIAAWEQAAIWIARKCLPGWTYDLSISGVKSEAVVKLHSPHVPPSTAEATHPKPAVATLLAIIQAHKGLLQVKVKAKKS